MRNQICTDQELPVRGSIISGALWAIILVAGFGGWAVTANLSGAVISQGVIEIEQDRQVVQHLEGGIVREILVREGDAVSAGQTLIRLDGGEIAAEMTIVRDQRYEVLARIARLEAERDDLTFVAFPSEIGNRQGMPAHLLDILQGQERLFDARLATLNQRVEQLSNREAQVRAQIEGARSRMASLRRQLDLIGQDRTTQVTLAEKGLAQASIVRDIDTRLAEVEGQIGALTSEIAASEERITEISLEVLSLRAERRETAQTELRDLVAREVELRERYAALNSRFTRLDIRAPADGVVHGMTVTTPQSVLRAAEAALYVVPQDRPLLISARIPPANIDQVNIGQNAVLVFPAFVAKDLPEIRGRIERISPDVFTDERSGMSWYEADISVAEESEKVLAGNDLIPGMPVEAYIQTGDRTAASYLMKPFTDFMKRAMREPA